MFPPRDIGNDPAKIRDWAQATEDLSFAYIFVMLYPMYRMPKLEDQIETLRRFKEVASG